MHFLDTLLKHTKAMRNYYDWKIFKLNFCIVSFPMSFLGEMQRFFVDRRSSNTNWDLTL